jgi:hypothetical protein
MDRSEFWKLIEETRAASQGDCEQLVELLQRRLQALPAEQIVRFKVILDELMAESYTWELWAAGYLINGGCSDDGFDYFRAWLIAQGEAIFTSALKDPETLADYPDEFPEEVDCESLMYAPVYAYKEKTGRDLFADMPRRSWPREPTGKRWEEEEVESVLPRLAARVQDRFSEGDGDE